MYLSHFHCHMLQKLLLFCTLPQLIVARAPLNPLSNAVFSNAFNLYGSSDKGGCDRASPNGVPMLQHTQASLGGAWALSQTAVATLPNYASQTYIRGLLFLFFGITFQENHQLSPGDNADAFTFITSTYIMVNRIFTNPGSNSYNLKPRYRCLEDYANYYTHMVRSNGQEDTSMPLIGELMDIETEGGFTRPPPYNDVWPGLMFVYHAEDRSGTWYMPNADSPQNGGCGYGGAVGLTATAFTDAKFDITKPDGAEAARVLYGITACPAHFNTPTLSELGTPTPNGGTAEIYRFQKTADLEDLHEAFHLVSENNIADQPIVSPPQTNPPDPNVWITNRNWASWIPSSTYRSYGYFFTAFLGLARPHDARLNADSFAIFALCLYFPELDCLGSFQNEIRTRRSSVPAPPPPMAAAAGLSKKALRSIREGRFDLRRDLPMDRDLQRRPREEGKRVAEEHEQQRRGDEEERLRNRYTAQAETRFFRTEHADSG